MYDVIQTESGFTVASDPTGKVYAEKDKAQRRSRDLKRKSSEPTVVTTVKELVAAIMPKAEQPKTGRGVYPAVRKAMHVRRAYA